MQKDPDNIAVEEACEALVDALEACGLTSITKRETQTVTRAVLTKWVASRSRAWAEQRGLLPFGDPDAHDIGFAKASLWQVKEKAIAHELPLSEPVRKWKPDEVATFLAIGAMSIEETRTHTLEDPSGGIPL